MNKLVHIAKSRQWYDIKFNSFLLGVPNQAVKEMYMLIYGTIKNTNSLCYSSHEVLIDYIDSIIAIHDIFMSNSIFLLEP